MSNIIPPLLSNSPPPPPTHEEDEEDEFGDFTGSNDLSYGCDSPSLPPSPLYSPKKQFDMSIPNEKLDINRNSKIKNSTEQASLDKGKDFQDRRKSPINSSIDSNYFNEFSAYFEPVDHSKSKAKEDIEFNKDAINSGASKKKVLDNNTDLLQGIQKTEVNNIETSISNKYLVGESVQETKNNVILETSKKVEHVSNNIEDTTENGEIKDEHQKHIESISLNDLCPKNEVIDDEDDFGNFVGHQYENVPQKCVLESEDIITQIQEQEVSGVPINENFVFDDRDLELKAHEEDFGRFSPNFQSEVVENLHDDFVHPKDFLPHCELPKQNVDISIEDLKEEEFSLDNNTQKTFDSKELLNKLEDLPERDIINVNKVYPSAGQDIEDDFANFEFHDSTAVDPQPSQIEYTALDDNNEELEDDFADFAQADTDFTTTTTNTASQEKPSEVNDEDDFDDFGDFESPTIVPDTNPLENKFGDFSSSTSIENIWLNSEQAVKKTEEVVTEMFPISEMETDEFSGIFVEKDDFLFNELKDVTETNAIKFHWANSACQKLLLRALNIDERNILYGPSWNPSMPRFAANLSLAPLEPVKSEVLSPVPIQKTDSIPSSTPSQTTSNTSVDIPVASFDWSKAGLTDPLDYSQSLLLDLEQIVATLDIPTLHQSSLSNSSTSPIHELDEWDVWLQSISMKDSDSVQFEGEESSDSPRRDSALIKSDLEQKSPSRDLVADDFNDFTSYQAPTVRRSPSWHNVLLRETYISNNENSNTNVNSSTDVLRDIEGWLQPTIVTPELPRKTIELDDDDEFDDFQTVTHNPIHISDDQLMSETPKLTVKPPETLETQVGDMSVPKTQVEDDFSEFASFDAKLSSVESVNTSVGEDTSTKSSKQDKSDDFSEFASFGSKQNAVTLVEATQIRRTQKVLDDFSPFTSFDTKNATKTVVKPNNAESLANTTTATDDDEFTDFHSSLPTQLQVLQPTTVLQPLKPQIVHVQASTIASNKISWPDPGVTEDDLKRFEFSYSRVQPKSTGNEKRVSSRSNSITENSVVALERKDSRSSITDRNVPVKKKCSTSSPDKSRQQVQKTGSLEDDEWSDFVSVKTASPIHRVANEKSRSSTPDLPLSVLNLSSIQPLKQPIPVITHQGIFQTKVSSNSDANMLNMQSVVQNNCMLQSQPQNNFYHPSIISSQYATQAYSNFNGCYPSGSSNMNSTHQKSSDDDEWSDFVSHQSFSKPTSSGNTSSSSIQPRTSWQSYNQPLNMSGWSSSATPNIITNPGSIDMLRVGSDTLKNNKQQQIKKTQVSNSLTTPPKRSTIPSITLPDLDFIAPKSRTSNRK